MYFCNHRTTKLKQYETTAISHAAAVDAMGQRCHIFREL